MYILQKIGSTQPVSDTPAKTERKMTNQLQFLLKATRALWRHHYAWPFHKPVDPVALNLPVSCVCEQVVPVVWCASGVVCE